MTDEELITNIECVRDIMISVSTGGEQINNANDRYRKIFCDVSKELLRRNIKNPITYNNLWDWYGRWSSGDLPSYQSRRAFVGELVNPLIDRIRTGQHFEEVLPTGWPRVDRTVGEIRDRLASAKNEEQYQAVGLLCRDALISLAQAVYIKEQHPSLDGIQPSTTDGKRMLDAYIASELFGGANEQTRKHARSALDLANALQHQRTASFRDAAMCVEATTAVINVIAILAGRRDPK